MPDRGHGSQLRGEDSCCCKRARITITGHCTICGHPRLHVKPKVNPAPTPRKEAA